MRGGGAGMPLDGGGGGAGDGGGVGVEGGRFVSSIMRAH